MNIIEDGKRALADSIDEELDQIASEAFALIARLRSDAKHLRGLNGLAASFNGIASVMEEAQRQVQEAKAEARTWLAAHKEPITEHTDPELMAEVLAAKGAEA